MSRIILPNGQAINKVNELEFMRREVHRLKRMLVENDQINQARLMKIHQESDKLDKIMQAAFDRADIYAQKLMELNIVPELLIKEFEDKNGRK